jgi:hypothetical protein
MIKQTSYFERKSLSLTLIMRVTRLINLLVAGLPFGFCFAPTDSISDADPAQSGYLPNHNMDPNIVNSTAFKVLWNATFNVQELVGVMYANRQPQLMGDSSMQSHWYLRQAQPASNLSSLHLPKTGFVRLTL